MSPHHTVLIAAALVGSALAGPARAQPTTPPASKLSAPAVHTNGTAPSMAASGSSANYRSAFEGYRAFTEQPVTNWRQSNDLVRQIGGWQAYAQEAQGGDQAPASANDTMPASHGGMKMPAEGGPSGVGQVLPLAPAASSSGGTPAPAKASAHQGHTMGGAMPMQGQPVPLTPKPSPGGAAKSAAMPAAQPASIPASGSHSGHH